MKCQESIVFYIELRDDSLSTSNDDIDIESEIGETIFVFPHLVDFLG